MRKKSDTLLSRRALLTIAAAQCVVYATRGPAAPQRGKTVMRFERDRFVEKCVAASRESESQRAVHEVLERAVADADAVLAGLGTPQQAGVDVLHRSQTLTIFAAHWAQSMSLPAHDHRMWALIGLYTGREDNIYWRRTANSLEAHRAAVLFPGDVATLPADAIHSV